MDAEEKEIWGLTAKEVHKRKEEGLVNGNFSVKTKSIGQIISSNIFTLFNFINIALAICLILVHSYKNMLFLGVVFWNFLIGVVQEVRSKRIIDKLSLMSEPVVKVLRDGSFQEISIEEIVLDDVFELKNGNQVCADAVILKGDCEVNESLLTGESDPVYRKCGDEVLSGSYIVSGSVLARAVHVGKDNYVSKITGQAKYIKKPNSEMLRSIRMIIKIISILLIPVAACLFYNQMEVPGIGLKSAVVSTVAAVIGMIPSGLVLLTSMVLAVSVIRLGQKNTLVQELYCIETLARVDTLCLDKTGTITEGVMDVDGVEILSDKFTREQIDEIIYFFTNGLNDTNPTFQALEAYSMKLYEKNRAKLEKRVQSYHVVQKISFSSDKKWSLVDFEKRGTYVLGALDFVLGCENTELKEMESHFAKDGVRVLILAHSDRHCDGRNLPEQLEPYAFILVTDRIRKNAPETIRYFCNQGVKIKIISGDNPQTVSNIAQRVGVPHAKSFVDANTLHTPEDIRDAAEKYTVFGRVTPAQKLDLVKTLKEQGHTIAMTGDGVNDVMALKEADCSIAMQSGSDAARNVSQLVLMDSDFGSMPAIVAEGRRTINNIQRSAALYLTKTIYSVVLALFFVFFPAMYPFQPIHLTLLGSLTIGIPSFILAMEPNLNRIKGKFLMNVLRMAIPGGLIVLTNVLAAEIYGAVFHISSSQTSAMAFFGLAIASLVELIKVCRPFNTIRIIMCGLIIGIFLTAVTLFGSFFEIGSLSISGWLYLLISLAVTPALFMAYSMTVDRMMGNTPNIYRICPVVTHDKEGIKNIILVEEEVEEKDYMDVAAQMMGLKVLKAERVAYIGSSQKGDIRVDSSDRVLRLEIAAAAAGYYVRTRIKKKDRKEEETVRVEMASAKEPVKVKVDLKNHQAIIIKTGECIKYRNLKRMKLTL